MPRTCMDDLDFTRPEWTGLARTYEGTRWDAIGRMLLVKSHATASHPDLLSAAYIDGLFDDIPSFSKCLVKAKLAERRGPKLFIPMFVGKVEWYLNKCKANKENGPKGGRPAGKKRTADGETHVGSESNPSGFSTETPSSSASVFDSSSAETSVESSVLTRLESLIGRETTEDESAALQKLIAKHSCNSILEAIGEKGAYLKTAGSPVSYLGTVLTNEEGKKSRTSPVVEAQEDRRVRVVAECTREIVDIDDHELNLALSDLDELKRSDGNASESEIHDRFGSSHPYCPHALTATVTARRSPAGSPN